MNILVIGNDGYYTFSTKLKHNFEKIELISPSLKSVDKVILIKEANVKLTREIEELKFTLPFETITRKVFLNKYMGYGQVYRDKS